MSSLPFLERIRWRPHSNKRTGGCGCREHNSNIFVYFVWDTFYHVYEIILWAQRDPNIIFFSFFFVRDTFYHVHWYSSLTTTSSPPLLYQAHMEPTSFQYLHYSTLRRSNWLKSLLPDKRKKKRAQNPSKLTDQSAESSESIFLPGMHRRHGHETDPLRGFGLPVTYHLASDTLP